MAPGRTGGGASSTRSTGARARASIATAGTRAGPHVERHEHADRGDRDRVPDRDPPPGPRPGRGAGTHRGGAASRGRTGPGRGDPHDDLERQVVRRGRVRRRAGSSYRVAAERDGTAQDVREETVRLRAGDVVVIDTSGGGGCREPGARARLRRRSARGYVAPSAASATAPAATEEDEAGGPDGFGRGGAAKGMGRAISLRLAGRRGPRPRRPRRPLGVVAAEPAPSGGGRLSCPPMSGTRAGRAWSRAWSDLRSHRRSGELRGTTGPVETRSTRSARRTGTISSRSTSGRSADKRRTGDARAAAREIVNIAGTRGCGATSSARPTRHEVGRRGFTRTVAPRSATGSTSLRRPDRRRGAHGPALREEAKKRGWTPEQVYEEYMQEMALRRVPRPRTSRTQCCFSAASRVT